MPKMVRRIQRTEIYRHRESGVEGTAMELAGKFNCSLTKIYYQKHFEKTGKFNEKIVEFEAQQPRQYYMEYDGEVIAEGTFKELAEQTGLSEKTVRNYASTDHHLINPHLKLVYPKDD